MPTPVPTKEQVLGPILASYLLWTSIGSAVLAFLASIIVEHTRKTHGGLEVHFNRAALAFLFVVVKTAMK